MEQGREGGREGMGREVSGSSAPAHLLAGLLDCEALFRSENIFEYFWEDNVFRVLLQASYDL